MKKTLAVNLDKNFNYLIPGTYGKKLWFISQNIVVNAYDNSSWITRNVKIAYEFLKDKEPVSSGLIGIASYGTLPTIVIIKIIIRTL